MKNILANLGLLVLLLLSLFYLFAVPVIAILHSDEAPIYGIAFGFFMLAQLIILNLEIGYIVIRNFYRIETDRTSLFFNRVDHLQGIKFKPFPDHLVSRIGTLFSCFLCYLITIYVFAVGYMYLSGFDSTSFSVGKQLGLVDSIYFSLVTATTVGFGDIHPVSSSAKIIVMFEIIIALMYVVVMFSSIANFLKHKPSKLVEVNSTLKSLRGYRLRKYLTSQSTARLRRQTR